MKYTFLDKLLYNEKDEISLTKVGIVLGTVGGMLVMNPITPVAVTLIIGKYLTAIGTGLGVIGSLSKVERRRETD